MPAPDFVKVAFSAKKIYDKAKNIGTSVLTKRRLAQGAGIAGGVALAPEALGLAYSAGRKVRKALLVNDSLDEVQKAQDDANDRVRAEQEGLLDTLQNRLPRGQRKQVMGRLNMLKDMYGDMTDLASSISGN